MDYADIFYPVWTEHLLWVRDIDPALGGWHHFCARVRLVVHQQTGV